MTTEDIHSCSMYCTRPACVLAQRDEMRDSHGAGNQVPPSAQPAPPMEQDAMGIAMVQAWDRANGILTSDAVHPTFQRGFEAGWGAAQPAAQPVQPQGWVLVPMELTPAMWDAACPADEMVDHFDMPSAYLAMIAARPGGAS